MTKQKTLTREEVVEKLKFLNKTHDQEGAHSMADDLLVEFLKQLGYDDIADAFKEIDKWYS